MSTSKWYLPIREKCAELFALIHDLTDESKKGDDISPEVAAVSPFSISTVEEKYKVTTDTDKKDKKGKVVVEDTLFPFDTLPKIRRDCNDLEHIQLSFVDILLWLISYSFEVDETSPVDSVIHTLRGKNRDSKTEGDSDAVKWTGVDYNHVLANILVPNLRTRISLAQKKIVTPKPKTAVEIAAERALHVAQAKFTAREDTFSAALQLTYDAMSSMPQGDAAWKKLCDDSPEHARFQSMLVRRAEKEAQDAIADAESDAVEIAEVS